MTTAQDLKKVFDTSSNILINMDTRTDFDSLSTSIVLARYLKSLRKNVTVIHAEKINPTFGRFYTHQEVLENTDISTVDVNDYDLIVFVDSGSSGHVSLNSSYKLPVNITAVNFDHHLSNDMFAQLNFVRKIGSCCSLLYTFFKEINFDCPKEYLDILIVGLLTDTGFFKYDSVTPEDFKISGEMVEKGVKLYDTLTKLDSYETIHQIRFKELVYKNLVCNFEKKYAYSTIKLAEIKEKEIDLSKVVVRHSDLLKYIEEFDITFVVSETDNNPKYIELSFRSKNPQIDVEKLAKVFGGGGHKTGAGAKLYNVESVEEAVAKVLTELAN